MRKLILVVACMAMVASAAQAAFIVETYSDGKAYANFDYNDGTAASYSIKATAPGLIATKTAFGGNGTYDEYVFSYTPGTNADNTTFNAGDALGTHRLDPPATLVEEAQTASGMVGGVSGTYKVYITWPLSGNVNTKGSKVTIKSDGADIVLDPVSQNGDPSYPGTVTDIGKAGANKWLCIGTVQLTAGTTYTVSQRANEATYVSQRSAGVMWERVPEPATMILFALTGLFVARRRRG